jgi:hypothetical protein
MLWLILVAVLLTWILHDIVQRKHAILRNFPIVGNFRYWLESLGPELRQNIVTGNDEERPFSRDQRRWVYASAKKANNYFGFWSDNDMEARSNYLIIKHDTFPLELPHAGDPGYDLMFAVPCAKVLGASRRRAKGFRPPSTVNVSGMSLRLPERAGGGGAESRCADRRLLAEHWRRRRVESPSPGRRSGVAGGHRLFRLPRD